MVDRLVNSEANARRINIVEQCFGANGMSLGNSGRVLVGEGVLTKLCRKKAKPRQFFLFNDIMVYGNIVIDKKKYNKQHIIPLEDVKIQSLENDGPWKNGWQFISPKKSFAVFAATSAEKAEWMAHINKCIVDLLAKTNKKPATELAAVWVPDSDANSCMHCLKVKFTPINRRHHCRKCGAVVCGACSNRRFLLPYQSQRPLRVCISCYDALTAAQAEKRVDRAEPLPSTIVSTDEEEQEPADKDNGYEKESSHEEEQGIEEGGGGGAGSQGFPVDESVEAHVPQQRYGSSDEEDDDAPEDGTNPMANTEPIFYENIAPGPINQQEDKTNPPSN